MIAIALLDLLVALQRQPSPPANSLPVDVAPGDESSKDVMAVLRELEAQDVKEVRQRGLSGIETIVVGLMSARTLASVIVRLLTMWKCGVVVDARGSRVLTQRNCDLPSGTVMVISPKGVQTKLSRPSDAQVQSLVKDFTSAK